MRRFFFGFCNRDQNSVAECHGIGARGFSLRGKFVYEMGNIEFASETFDLVAIARADRLRDAIVCADRIKVGQGATISWRWHE